MSDDLVFFKSNYQHDTEDAVLVIYQGQEMWIPKSVIEDEPEDYANLKPDEEIKLGVKKWWAELGDLEEDWP